MQQIKRWIHRDATAGAPLYLIVGLGNPGEQYVRNRHNIGFQCIDRLAEAHGIAVQKKRFHALLGEGQIGAQRVVLAKPLTFMNDSGRAVATISRWYKIPPERILVIYDDLDLPLGKVRVRPGGSSGGHRGMNSIITELGTSEFPRIRVGIGRPTQGDPIDYVLNNFGPDQEPIIAQARQLVTEIVPYFLQEGVRKTMNAYNG